MKETVPCMQNQKKTRAEMWQAIKFTLFSISAGVIRIGSFELFSKAFGWSYLRIPDLAGAERAVEGFVQLLRDRQMLLQLLGYLVVNHCFHLLLYMVCFHAIGMEVTVYEALLYNSMSWLSGGCSQSATGIEKPLRVHSRSGSSVQPPQRISCCLRLRLAAYIRSSLSRMHFSRVKPGFSFTV